MSLILDNEPLYKWNSLWQPIEYVLHHYDVDFTGVTDNGGNAKIEHDTHDYSDDLHKYVYLSGSVYNGMFYIIEITDATHITIDTPYISTDTGGVGLISAVTTTKLVAGYPNGHIFNSSNPERDICYIRAEASPIDGKVHIRIETYLQAAFEIHPPVAGYDYWMSTPFEVVDDGLGVLDSEQRYAINAAITTADLQPYTLPGPVLLTDQINFLQSPYIQSQIVNDGVFNTITI